MKYNYKSRESQKLLEEFTITLSEITQYIEERERYIIQIESQLNTKLRIRSMIKEIFIRIANTTKLFIKKNIAKLR